MKAKVGHKGETLLRNLISGLNEAKRKWTVRYHAAVTEEEQLNALNWMNFYGSWIEETKSIVNGKPINVGGAL